MTSIAVARADATAPDAAPVLDIVVPVYDEERDLEPSIRRLHAFLRESMPFDCRITIADNASTDGTFDIAQQLAETLPGVSAVRLAEKGRGRALSAVWASSDASVLAYMDVDLSTDLRALLPLVAPVVSGHSDLAIGTRLSRSARVVRGPKRELISRCYNALLHASLGTRFSDAQCGFKAIRVDCAKALLPLVEDTGWFFDTELLVLAERAGLRIHEVPVDWVDDPDSRVDIVATALADIKGIVRVNWRLAGGSLPLDTLRAELNGRRPDLETAPPGLGTQAIRFAVIGAMSTLAYLFLYVVARSFATAQVANALALLLTAIANTAANRRWTFALRGPAGAIRHQVQGLIVFAAALLLTSASLAALSDAAPHASRATEVVVLVVANLFATALRFTALRAWVFRSRSSA